MGDILEKAITLPLPSASLSSSSFSSSESEPEELQLIEHAPPFWRNPRKKRLSKQLSMCETPRDIAWEKRRRRQILHQERKNVLLTDEDLNELKGSIELGFGFNEEQGQRLCNTLPALDLYFAVNRQLSTSPVSSPTTPPQSAKGLLGARVASSSSLLSPSLGSSSKSLGGDSSSIGSPSSDSDSWKILSPGDAPEQVKTKLRHWAQAVACSVMQSH